MDFLHLTVGPAPVPRGTGVPATPAQLATVVRQCQRLRVPIHIHMEMPAAEIPRTDLGELLTDGDRRRAPFSQRTYQTDGEVRWTPLKHACHARGRARRDPSAAVCHARPTPATAAVYAVGASPRPFRPTRAVRGGC